MPALVAGIHVFAAITKSWMAGTSPAMTGGRTVHAGLGGSSTMRAISESTVSRGFSVASITAGSAAALPSVASMTFFSRLAMRRAQVGLGEHCEDRFVGLLAGKIDLVHQAAEARCFEAHPAVGRGQREPH